ncbi:hypothetical protein C7B77_00565 [Chamaesiphon polymorphus CCALA 037]|uniref:Uncharacterized protein n=1 Tax=Chamaesiphon polymorphus CCALA 037 TaxID=2107692 RepID=A0A2T1GNM0_9CYAN|nr:hypothetical protein C7B77_00565 [Chamaesiphon polymorphus CCALA 037]
MPVAIFHYPLLTLQLIFKFIVKILFLYLRANLLLYQDRPRLRSLDLLDLQVLKFTFCRLFHIYTISFNLSCFCL